MQIGFGKASLWGTWQTSKRLADDILVRVLAARGDGGKLCILAVGDEQSHHRGTALALRDAIADAVGTTPDHVGIFSTQNHGIPVETPALWDYARYTKAYTGAAREAVSALRPAEMAAVAVTPNPALTFKRRVRVDGLGAFTFWFGMRARPEGPDVEHLLRQALAGLCEGRTDQVRCKNLAPDERFDAPAAPLPVASPCFLPPADDPLLQGLFFRALDGQPLGSVLRFAAHPAVSNYAQRDWHSGDFPAYACRHLEAAFGGGALFLTGPTGDQCPLIEHKGLAQTEALGTRLADLALGELASAPWSRTEIVRAHAEDVLLTPSRAYRMDPAERAAALEQARSEFRAGGGSTDAERRAALLRLKRLSDEIERLGTADGARSVEEAGLDPALLAQPSVAHPLFALRLGTHAIVGLPGEPFGSYSAQLRARTLGARLLVCEEGNGYLGYFPTDAEQPLGGYESNVAFFEHAERPMLAAAERAVTALFKDA